MLFVYHFYWHSKARELLRLLFLRCALVHFLKNNTLCLGSGLWCRKPWQLIGVHIFLLSKLGQFCKWKGVVLIRLGDLEQREMVPGKPVCVVTLLKNNPYRWKCWFCQSCGFLAAAVVSAVTWWLSPSDSDIYHHSFCLPSGLRELPLPS